MTSHASSESQPRETRRIGADTYCQLATSRRVLWRSDDDVRGMRGLYDPQLGVRYVVEARQLLMRRPVELHSTANA
jgi:hypothetical protein